MRNNINAILATIAGVSFNIVKHTTTNIPERLSPYDIIVGDPLDFLEMISGNGKSVPSAPKLDTDAFDATVRERAVKRPRRGARKKATAKTFGNDNIYRAKGRTDKDGQHVPRIGVLRLTNDDVRLIEEAVRNKDNGLSPAQRYILTHHLGLLGNPSRPQFEIANELFGASPSDTTSRSHRDKVRKEERAALKSLGVWRRRRRRRPVLD